MINQILLSFLIYFLALLIIGIYFYKKNKTEGMFALGNRSLNYWVTAISAQTSDMGSWLFLGYPAVVYANGLFEAWTAIGLVVFMFLNWHFIAKKIRAETEKYKSLTLSSYFESRYNDTSGIIKISSALITFIFFTFYIAAGLVGIGRIFESAFNIDYTLGVLIGTTVTIIYTLIGGFLAVTWCNLIQGIFLLAMIFLVPIFAYSSAGGFYEIKSAILAKNISMSLFPSFGSVLGILFLTFGWGLGYFGQPHILVNFMGLKNIEDMKKAKYVGIIWQILALFAAIAIGLIGIAFFQDKLQNPEHLFVYMAKDLFSPFIAGFALCGILAATLSTINTQILVTATGLSEDIYKVKRKNATSGQLLFVTRISIILVTIIALFLSLTNSDSIYNLVFYSWAGIGSAFAPLVILSLYSNRVNKYGAISGILSGGIISGIWPYLNSSIPSLIPGFFISFTLILMISYITMKR